MVAPLGVGRNRVLTLALLSWRERRLRGLALAGWGLACFVAAPQWWFPSGGNRELHWAVWEQALGSSYVAWAVAVLATSACLCRRSLSVAPASRLPAVTAVG